MYLVANTSNPLFTRAKQARNTKSKEVFGAEVAEKMDVAMTPLQWMLTPISLRKIRETSLKSSTLPAIR